jgi:hypothetical protein
MNNRNQQTARAGRLAVLPPETDDGNSRNGK